MISIAAEAASWALAAELSRRVGPRYRLLEGHPAGGEAELLWFVTSDKSSPDIRLNRLGRISIANGDVTVDSETWWRRLASGEDGVKALADRVVAELPTDAPMPMTQSPSYAGIAAVLRDAALCGQDWRCLHGYLDHPHGSEPRSELFAPYSGAIRMDHGSDTANWASRYWFLKAADTPLACFDTQKNELLRPHTEPVSLPADATRSSELASATLAPLLRQAVQGNPPRRPGLGLPATLARFNRKERFFLLGAACDALDQTELHSPSLRLGNALRRDLHALLGWHVPAHAWTAMDYHLNWLHAAMQWFNGGAYPGQRPPLPLLTDDPSNQSAPLVTGTQEDADLIIAWTTQHGPRLILIEAKAYGAWDNKQATSKVRRVESILEATEEGSLELRLVFASPRKPQHLDVTNWPSWAITAEPSPLIHPPAAWLPLPVPSGRLSVERTDEQGQSFAAGRHWHITGP